MNNLATTAFRYVIRVVALDLALAVIVCAALAVIERSLRSFGYWLFWAGVIIMGVGLLSVVGSAGITRSGSYAVGRTVGEQDVAAQTNADLKDEAASYSFLILATGAGVLAMLISQLF